MTRQGNLFEFLSGSQKKMNSCPKPRDQCTNLEAQVPCLRPSLPIKQGKELDSPSLPALAAASVPKPPPRPPTFFPAVAHPHLPSPCPQLRQHFEVPPQQPPFFCAILARASPCFPITLKGLGCRHQVPYIFISQTPLYGSLAHSRPS